MKYKVLLSDEQNKDLEGLFAAAFQDFYREVDRKEMPEEVKTRVDKTSKLLVKAVNLFLN